ncbi:MAG: isocitrate lyase/PEP mutase family protein [Streptomycetales bacterium]
MTGQEEPTTAAADQQRDPANPPGDARNRSLRKRSQAERAAAFRVLHERPGAFILPNPWDAGSARLLASLGFEALATTSLGLANTLGRPDGVGAVSPAEVLDNCRAIVAATDLPVSADLENGYAHQPRAAAEMIRRAAGVGAVGGSIEDATGEPADPIYDFQLAVERVQAAVETARALPIPFVLTARAENFLHGRRDLDDTIRRLQAFGQAGADVLYAPGLRDLATIRTVVASVGKPLNVVTTTLDPSITAGQLAEAGVKRISVGGSLSRLALAAFLAGAREMRDSGGLSWMRDTVPSQELKMIFSGWQ